MLATGGLMTMSAHASAPPAYAAQAAVSSGPYFVGDATGSLYTFTVENTGASTSIGAVEISRPATWTVSGCPSAPAGWAVTTSTTKCRYRSGSGTGDDIQPGATATFGVLAKTDPGSNDRTGTWALVASSSNHFDNPSLLRPVSEMAPGLGTTLHTFELTRAVVATTTPLAGGACPAANTEAIAGSTKTIVICGRNRATAALTPVAAHSSLGGTFVAAAGTFASRSIPKKSGVVVLGTWSGTTIGSHGTGKTVVARIGAASNRTSPLTTFTGYSATSRPPTAGADSYAVNEDVTLVVPAPGVLANDTDPDGDPLIATHASTPANGTVALASDGSFTYTPNAHFFGTDTFTYKASDTFSTPSTATVTITVAPMPDAPDAVADTASTGEDAATAIGVLTNDSDADGDALHVSSVDVTGVQGTVTNHGTHVSYDPNGAFEHLGPGQEATESFSYTVNDGALTDVATVTVTVTGVNDAPVARADAVTTDEATAAFVAVLGNDEDAEGALAVTAIDRTGTAGTVTDNGDGTVTYDPAGAFEDLGAGEQRTDTFTYTVTDAHGATATATVTVTVGGVNDAPLANNDAATVGESSGDTPVAVLGNDDDPESDALTVSSVDVTGTQGLVTNYGTHVSYDPNGAFEGLTTGETGTTSFTYTASDGNGGTDTATVTITIAGENDAPVAADDTAATTEDAGKTLAVLANDSDAEGPFTITYIGTAGTHGAVTDNGDGTVTYDPNGQFDHLGTGGSASDTFTYTITDSEGVTDTATVTVAISGINDAPFANDDTASVTEDTGAPVQVLDNDTDAEGTALNVSSVDVTGVLGTVTNHGTHVSYDPNGQFEHLADGQTATESFTYTASDGGLTSTATVTVTVGGVNDAPAATDDAYDTLENTPFTAAAPGVLGNDTDDDAGAALTAANASDPAHGAVTLNADGSFTYTPDTGYTGLDTFTYDVTDGTATDSATVTMTVIPPNARPTAAAASGSGNEDGGAITITLTGTDADGDGLTFDAGTATSGLVTVPAAPACDGATPSTCTTTVTYTPNANFNGTDSFTYTVHDGTVESAPATATITVNAVNDAPSFTKGADQTAAEDAGAQSVSNWASAISKGPGDESAQSLSFTTTNTNNALFSVQPGVTPLGTLVYTPAPDKYGSATVTITLSDSGGTANGGVDTSPAQTFTITVTPVNDVPVADDDTHTPHEDQLASIDVLAGDTDADPTDVLTVGGLTNTDADGNDGVLTVNSDQTVSYDPRGEFDHLQVGGSEVDTFTYTVSDGNGGTDTATVTVTVTGVNDNPTATPKSHTAIGNTLLVVNDTAPSAPHTSTTANHLLVGVTDPDDTVFTASAPAASVNGGTVAADTDGSFTFLPPAGHRGSDSFTFTVTDAHGGSDTDTTTVSISEMVWYVDASGAAGGTGRSTQPLTGLAPLSTGGSADPKDAAGDHVFVYQGTYTDGLVLEANQKLWGQPHGLSVASTALVPAGGANPVVSSGSGTGDAITLANGVDVQRVDVGASTGVGIKGVSVTNATVGPNTNVADAVSLTGPASGTIAIGSTVANASTTPVTVGNRSGGAVTFSGPVTSAGGVLLQNNTGAAVSLTGQLTLTTGAGDGFVATGGGTVTAPHTSNAVTTTSGRGVVVQNTSIGGTDLVFRSVNVNAAGTAPAAPASGIVLSSTGSTGNLTVLGTGTAGSGGTIRGTSGPGIDLTTTRDVALSHVKVQDAGGDGLTGSGVTNLTLTGAQVLGAGNADEERAVDLTNVSGALTIDGGTYDDASDDLVKVHNTNTNVTVDVKNGATFSNQTQTNAGNAFDLVPNGTSAITSTFNGLTFTNLKNTSVNLGAAQIGSSGTSALTFTNNTVNGGTMGGAGVVVSGQEATRTNVTITGNGFTGAGGNGVVAHDANDSSLIVSTVANNTLTGPKGHGIFAAADEDGDIRVRIDGNTITNAGGDGIELVNFGDDSAAAQTSTAHFVVTNNTVTGHSANPAAQFVGAIGVFHFENDADTTCARVSGNSVSGTPAGFYDVFLQDSSSTGRLTFEEVPNTAATGTVANSFVHSLNPSTTLANIDNIGAVYSNGVACTNP